MMRKRPLSIQNIENEESLINLTPLIDVVFVVLIMFILIAPMLDLDRISLAASEQKAGQDKLQLNEGGPVQIEVDAENRIFLNRKAISQKDLKEELISLHRQFPQIIPKLYQDRLSHFESYQCVKNAVEASGFDQLDVVLKAR